MNILSKKDQLINILSIFLLYLRNIKSIYNGKTDYKSDYC